MKKNLTKLFKIIILFFISIYQNFISPLIPQSCRYYPSCSNYAKDSLRIHGLFGILLIVKRILKCNPFFLGGYDPVPVKNNKKRKKYE